MSELLLDAAGRRRSPATLPEFHAGRPPRNKGLRYPADPPTIEEIVTVVRRAGGGVHGRRLRGLIVVLWRAGLRICEALALAERAAAAAHGRPRVAPLTTQNSGPTGSSTRAWSQGASCLPGPVVHADLAAAAALAAPHQQRAAARIQVGLGERERLADAQAGSPEDDDPATQPTTVDTVAGAAHHRNDLLDRRRVGRVAHPLIARRTAGMELRQGGG